MSTKSWQILVTYDNNDKGLVSLNNVSMFFPDTNVTLIFDLDFRYLVCLIPESARRRLGEEETQLAIIPDEWTEEAPIFEIGEDLRTWNEAFGDWFGTTLGVTTIGYASYKLGIPFFGSFFDWSGKAIATIVRIAILQKLPGTYNPATGGYSVGRPELLVNYLKVQDYWLLNSIPGTTRTVNTYKPALTIAIVCGTSMYYLKDMVRMVITGGIGASNLLIDTYDDWWGSASQFASEGAKAGAGGLERNIAEPAGQGILIGIVLLFVIYAMK